MLFYLSHSLDIVNIQFSILIVWISLFYFFIIPAYLLVVVPWFLKLILNIVLTIQMELVGDSSSVERRARRCGVKVKLEVI